jgi:hypothetical protein
MDALRYLDGQPAVVRDEAYHATYSACREAVERKASIAEARCILRPGAASRRPRRRDVAAAGLGRRRRFAERLTDPGTTSKAACLERRHRLSPMNDESLDSRSARQD